jgi:hypothetical protein
MKATSLSRRLALTLMALPAAAAAQESGLGLCRALQDPAARLQCYDALPLAAPASPAAVPAAKIEQEFGLAETARPANRIDTITARIPGEFRGWQPQTVLELDNGQAWRIADGSTMAYRLVNPSVTVRRGVLGAYYLEIQGLNTSPRVKRVR